MTESKESLSLGWNGKGFKVFNTSHMASKDIFVKFYQTKESTDAKFKDYTMVACPKFERALSSDSSRATY